MKNLLYFFALLFTLGAVLRADSASKPDALRVEVRIFSGRPNPVFVITDPDEIRTILAQAAALPARSAVNAEEGAKPRALGYTGIAITNLSTASSDVQSVLVHRTTVQVTRKKAGPTKTPATAEASAAAQEVRLDSSAALENRLLGLAYGRGAIDSNLLAKINRQK